MRLKIPVSLMSVDFSTAGFAAGLAKRGSAPRLKALRLVMVRKGLSPASIALGQAMAPMSNHRSVSILFV